MRTVELKPYYWFQAVPIFPDAYGPEMEDVDPVTIDINDKPVELQLRATDRDNNDANIHFSLASAPATRAGDADPAAVASLDGDVLTITPVKTGTATIGVNVESNGKTARHAIAVTVSDNTTAVSDVVSSPKVYTQGRELIAIGCAGTGFTIINMAGEAVDTFTAASDRFTRALTLPAGVYVVLSGAGLAKKIIVK